MKLYNSLTRKKEEFVPKDKSNVTTYSCGPTVYYYPHIGNMRAYIFMDSLRRALKFFGYKTNSLMNITDVGHLTSDEDDGDDKMEVAAKRENKSVKQIAEYYTNIFFDNFKKLNILFPENIEKATENIDEMINFVKVLEEKGYTYKLDDGIYFDTQKFAEYGKLSGKKFDADRKGRVEENTNKKHPFDFALWKAVADNHIMKWDSPFGVGCPGWHIECSAMSGKHFCGNIDIHTGGIDHLSVHHENEIAQNNAFYGKKVVSFWMHCEFLSVDGGKMSKSLNNIYTIEQLEKMGYSALDFKYFCLLTHYRKAINFTFDALNAAKNARQNLLKTLVLHKNSNSEIQKDSLKQIQEEFLAAVGDDLNTPLAIAALQKLIKLPKSKEVYKAALLFDEALGLNLENEIESLSQNQVPENIQILAEQRWQAKKDRYFALADQKRAEIEDLGFVVLDRRDGFDIEKK